MKSVLRQARISPRKANLAAGLVRGKDVKEALDILNFTSKKGAKMIYKVVKSATSNAQNNFKQNLDNLYIKEIIVNEGMTYKRSMPVSRGRSHPILKRNAHITVKIDVKAETPKSTKPIKKETDSK